ncbi:MAG: hypothetical protein LBJ43_04680 [Propionibacteriaceae bacterium]|nr:hypothetical protein [Propionibacteriaceae bacterium]
MESQHFSLAGDIIRVADNLRIERPDGLHCYIGGLPATINTAIRALEQSSAVTTLEPIDERVFNRLLNDLEHQGMLSHPDTAPPLRVALIGSRTLASQVGLALLTPTVRLTLYQSEPPRRLQGSAHARAATRSITEMLRRAAASDITPVTSGGHWTTLNPTSCDLAVIAADTATADRAIASVLLHQDIPHLSVTAHLDSATIGPLTDTRGGACLTCTDQFRSDYDADWPTVVSALSTIEARPNPLLAQWAAVESALAVHWFRCGHNVLRSLTLHAELTGSGVVRRRWMPHPACSCASRHPTAALPLAA